jgi:voltage-gated potassium channel
LKGDNKNYKGKIYNITFEEGHYLNNLFSNERLKKIVDAIIIIWIVADIIILTAMYFVDMNNVYNYIIIFDTGLCAVLFVQFVFKIHSHENKKQYIKEDWRGIIIDIIAMMPYELLTFGSYGILSLLRLFRIFALFGKSRRNIFNFIEKTKMNYIFLSLLIIVIASSIAILVLEGSPTSQIQTPLDAVWYVVSTVTTVGYGNDLPVTFDGKILGIILMIVGVVFFSLLTATLSSWFMRGIETEEEDLKDKVVSMEITINEMRSEIKEFKELLKKNK